MNSGRRTILWILAGAALVAVFYFFGNKKLKHDWKETYSSASKEPYGTQVLVKLLENFFPGKGFYPLNENFEVQLSKTQTGSNYVFIGPSFFLDSAESKTLLDFVAAGNTAFFSTKIAPFDFLSQIIPEYCEEGNWLYYEGSYRDSTVVLNFLHPDLEDKNGYQYAYVLKGAPSVNYLWSYLTTETYCDSLLPDYENLGSLDDQINYLRVPFGAGQVLLHCTPIAFTNYHLLEEKKLAYAEKALSYLSEGPIYFDLKRAESGKKEGA